MERNVYGALLALAVLGLLINIEWLFLTFILLAAGLFLAERFSSPAPSFEGTYLAGPEGYTAPQQPIVIQSATQSPSSNMMMDMISNLVQESTMYHRSDSPMKKMEHSLDSKLTKIDKKLKQLHEIEHKLQHIEEHMSDKRKGGGHG